MNPLLLDPSETLIKGASPQGLAARKVSNTQLLIHDPSHPLFLVSSSGILLGSWRYPSIPLQLHSSIVFFYALRCSVV
jgi:hypothetical protein